MSTTLRVSAELHARIAHMAKERGQRMQDVITEALDTLERERFWNEFNESVRRLRADPDAWAEVLAERAIWDRATKDGIDPDDGEW